MLPIFGSGPDRRQSGKPEHHQFLNMEKVYCGTGDFEIAEVFAQGSTCRILHSLHRSNLLYINEDPRSMAVWERRVGRDVCQIRAHHRSSGSHA